LDSANVALLRRQIDAYNRGDFEAALEGTDPAVEWVVAREHPAARTVRGHDELREYHRDWQGTMPGLAIELVEVDERGESVLTVCRMRGAGAGSGAEVVVVVAFVNRFRDGRVVRVEEYLDADEARRAL
jgi:ketosteroid isomerase-like protein